MSSPRVAKALVGSAVAIAAGAGFYFWWFSPAREPLPRLLPPEESTVAPGPGPDLKGGFILTAAVGEKNGVREIRLRSGEIEALLRLADATDYAGDEASGRAIFSVDDRAAGGRFVAGLARWLGASVTVQGTAPAGKLPPLHGTYVRLPKSEGWEHYRLVFAHGASHAEMLFDLAPGGDRARLVEADSRTRDGLVVFLQLALRDGFTRHVDFAPGPPLWRDFHPLVGENGALVHAWPAKGGTAWGAINRGRESTIVWWSALDHEPTEITKLPGLVTHLVPAPRERKAAVVLVHPSQDYPPGASGYAANDPVELVIVDATAAEPIPAIAAGKELSFKPQVMWSPLGTSVAVEVATKDRRQVRVIDVSNERDVSTSEAADEIMLVEWTTRGLVYTAASGGGKPAVFRWLPEHGHPAPFEDQVDRKSPDGRFSFRLTEGGVEVTGPEGVMPIPIVYSELREALEYESTVRAWWLGAHQLLVIADDLLELDLGTREFRYLFPEDRSLLLQGTSPDGAVVIARDETDRLVWARVESVPAH